MNFSNSKERIRFFRFAIVGTFGAFIDFGIFNLIIALTPVPPIWASAISFVAAVLSNFLGNRYWTYPDSRSKPVTHQLIQFSVVSIVGMGIRISLFALLEDPLVRLSIKMIPTAPISPTTIGHNATLAVAILVVMLWNFFVNRFWTYNDVDKVTT